MTENFGILLACAARGITFNDFEKTSHMVDTIEDEGEVMHKQAAGLAAQMYEGAGKCDRLGYHLFKKLATHTGRWSRGYTELVKPVYEALGENPMSKQAGWIENISSGARAVADNYRAALAASVAAGGGLGALAWQMGQEDVEQDADAARQQAQLEYLNNITESIDDKLRRRGVAA